MNFIIKHIRVKSSLLLFYSFLFFSCFSICSFAQPPTPTGFAGITGATVICQATTGTVTLTAPVGTPPFTFQYNVNGGALKSIATTGSSTNVSFPLDTIPGVYIYSVITVSDANYGPTAQMSNTATIEVQAMPTVTSTGGTTTTICPDGGSHTIPAGAITYSNGAASWGENGAGSITAGSGSTTPTYTSTLGDAGQTITLTLNVSSTNTCATQPPAVATYTIGVKNKMSVTKSLSPSKANFCFNESPALLLLGVTSGGTPPYSFTYSENGINKVANTVGTNTLAAVGGITTDAGSKTYNLVSVSDANCSQIITTGAPITMTVNPLPTAMVEGNEQACKFSSPFPSVNFIGSGTQKPYYMTYSIDGVIQPLITLSVKDTLQFPHSTSAAGIFTYSLIGVSDAYGCSGSITQSNAKVTIFELPSANFRVIPDRVPLLRPTITIEDASVATENWLWNFGDSEISTFQNPGTHTYSDSGSYTVKLIATNSFCKDSTSQPVTVYIPFSLYVPSAFSPNNDDVNDVFSPKGDGYKYYDMTIFDRWGNKLFYTNDMKIGWDGRVEGGTEIAQMDAVVYVINIVDLDDKTHIFYGHITTAPR